MLTLNLPRDVVQRLVVGLRHAGRHEIGGILMAEHVGPNVFTVRELTIHGVGAVARFVRRIEDAVGRLRAFFSETNHDYTRFNYVGEWHSHPLFDPHPSGTDDAAMREIVMEPTVGATFVVLLIVKLDAFGALVATLHTYLPDGSKVPSTLALLIDGEASGI